MTIKFDDEVQALFILSFMVGMERLQRLVVPQGDIKLTFKGVYDLILCENICRRKFR